MQVYSLSAQDLISSLPYCDFYLSPILIIQSLYFFFKFGQILLAL